MRNGFFRRAGEESGPQEQGRCFGTEPGTCQAGPEGIAARRTRPQEQENASTRLACFDPQFWQHSSNDAFQRYPLLNEDAVPRRVTLSADMATDSLTASATLKPAPIANAKEPANASPAPVVSSASTRRAATLTGSA
jgi:hypothetical protein